jgi:hypothetical protein
MTDVNASYFYYDYAMDFDLFRVDAFWGYLLGDDERYSYA